MYKSIEELRTEHGVVPLSQKEQTREVAEGDKPQSLLARVIILTQACDLANGKTARVVVAAVHEAVDLVQGGRSRRKPFAIMSARDRSTVGTSSPLI